LFETFGLFAYEMFLHDGSEMGVGHLPNDNILVALLVALALQVVIQSRIEILDRILTSIEGAVWQPRS
jgi:hypothetical protein